MRFIQCYDIEIKEYLIKNNYKLLSTQILNGKETFVFLNNGKKLNFESENVKFTNKLMF